MTLFGHTLIGTFSTGPDATRDSGLRHGGGVEIPIRDGLVVRVGFDRTTSRRRGSGGGVERRRRVALVSRRFTGGILALALLAVMGASALQLDGLFDTLELDGDLTWNAEVLDEPNSGEASNRTFFRGDGSWASVGLQDAAHAILTADTSTMSSTYVRPS